MDKKQEMPYIPYDVYESPQELILVVPLGGVNKDSVKVSLEEYRLVIRGVREEPELKKNLTVLKDECFRGEIEKAIDLPPQVYFDKIHSKLTKNNILEIVVPKSVVPGKMEIEVSNE